MYYKQEELKKIQEIEIEILQEIIRLCEENNLQYFIIGGTLLGCIRHEGFIPWDDDIDIGMLREDYEKFLKIAPLQLKNGYTLQHFSTEKNTPTYFAKVRKDGTEFIEKYTRKIKMHHGIFVDIMPYDYIPEESKLREQYNKKTQRLGQLYIAKTVWTTSITQNKKKKIFGSIARACLHLCLLFVPKKKIFERLDKSLTAYNGIAIKMLSSRGRSCFECKLEDLFPLKIHRFENIKVYIPAEADKLLKTQYGDYMVLPPEEKRKGHAPYKLTIKLEEKV